jgi:tight adherence protein B
MTRIRRVLLAGPAAAATLILAAGPAWAAPEGRIQQVQSEPGAVEFVLSAEGLAEGQSIDPASVQASINGIGATTSASPITESVAAPSRTVLLTLDTSGSMAENNKMQTAKDAANAYLAALPADVDAGLVTFADEAAVAVEPTEDRAAVRQAINALQPAGATALNDAVILSVETLGAEGSRNIVLLSDGEDEGSDASARRATRAVRESGVVLDAVSLGTGEQEAQLARFARAGNGTTVTATDAQGLTEAFEAAARTVETQLAVRAEVPEGVAAGTAELTVTALVGETTITDSTAALIADGGAAAAPTDPLEAYGPKPVAPVEQGVLDQPWFLWTMIGLVFAALAVILGIAFGALDRKNRTQGRVKRRLEEVALVTAPGAVGPTTPDTVLGESATVRRAVSFADKVAASRDTTIITHKLEAASVSLRPGEWVIVHALIAILAGLLTTLLSNFNLLFAALAFAAGLVAPWLFLTFRADRRRKQFYQQLPDAMQMLAGSLSAGYSLPQAIDNVARETGGPLGQELNRALMESRLGLPIEETLEAAAQRMESKDFHWVVMAIRINRQVGGNLAEVLTNVGRTIRERERLRRQVKALSAEGVLSAWVLGLLPVMIALFVAFTRPEYLVPMFTQPIGWVMIAVGLVLYIGGVIWMRNLVTMEV